MDYKFDLPTHHKSIIKVIGVGGGGSNAVSHMFSQGIKDVEFVIVNTDLQALKTSMVPNRLQIGINLTEGLGAGANPEKGASAAVESKEDIRNLLSDGTKMVFITAGMGGGTGTGAAPVIAQVAKDLDILTVGIVTAPFKFEGRKKTRHAQAGIEMLRQSCDSVLVILNDNLREIYGNLSITQAFGHADNVLTTAAKGIAEIITVPGEVNVDFEDVKTVMKNAGAAVMGSAITHGEGRALRGAEEALASPLLDNKNILGAQKVLLSITSGEESEMQMDELTDITDYIQDKAGEDAEVIFGHGKDPELGESIRVTVIATGFQQENLVQEGTGTEATSATSHMLSQPTGQMAQPAVQPVAQPTAPQVPDNERKVFDLDSEKQIGLFDGAATPAPQANPNTGFVPPARPAAPVQATPAQPEPTPVQPTQPTPAPAPVVANTPSAGNEGTPAPATPAPATGAPVAAPTMAGTPAPETPAATDTPQDAEQPTLGTAGYTFEAPAPRPEEPQADAGQEEGTYLKEPQEEPRRVYFFNDLGPNDDVERPEAQAGQEINPSEPMPTEPTADPVRQHERRLREQAEARKQALRGQKHTGLTNDEVKEKLDVPAYLRRKVKLKDVPHSSEQHISKYNLNDDSQILGNNKFLHDNVD